MGYDVSIFRSERPTVGGATPQVLADATDSGATVSGSRKLMQRVTLHLMTVAGSIPRSDAGSPFVSRLVNGKVTTETDVFVILTSSLGVVARAVRAEESDDDPDDEKLAGLQTVRLLLEPGAVVLTVRVRTAAGVREEIDIPLNFLLQ